MKWKDYEIEIFKILTEMYKDANISFNQKIKGRYSKINRQIDVLIEAYIAGKKIRLIVDGKYFNKKIDVKEVEAFISMVEDVDAKQGILITCIGYSEAAINRAYYGPLDIELDILNFKELKEHQGFGGIIHYEKYAAIIPAPFGWIVDGIRHKDVLCTLYQRGLNLYEAGNKKEFMYVNLYIKGENILMLNDLLKLQESKIKNTYPSATIEYNTTIKRSDNANTLIRSTIIDDHANEYTGFIEFDEFILFVVLFSPLELSNKNIRKLEYIIERIIPLKMKEKNNSNLESELNRLQFHLNNSSDFIEIAGILIKQGEILTQQQRYEEALAKFDESISYIHNNYSAIKGKIELGLAMNQNSVDLIPTIESFFSIDSSNPGIFQDLIELFSQYERINDLINYLFQIGIEKFNEKYETIGNFNYHIGYLLDLVEKDSEAIVHFSRAKWAFKKCYEKDHYIFSLINQNIKEIKNCR